MFARPSESCYAEVCCFPCRHTKSGQHRSADRVASKRTSSPTIKRAGKRADTTAGTRGGRETSQVNISASCFLLLDLLRAELELQHVWYQRLDCIRFENNKFTFVAFISIYACHCTIFTWHRDVRCRRLLSAKMQKQKQLHGGGRSSRGKSPSDFYIRCHIPLQMHTHIYIYIYYIYIYIYIS